ncbi:hypothetical protein [Burkholderia cenocepacia]|uniref:hypothetical protein n=1 Tax=Burkholderia cenocepacia TaxID=95486 RepID=UPI001FC821A5|nr:hypothetical protein [Burkholderia cenocepacia]
MSIPLNSASPVEQHEAAPPEDSNSVTLDRRDLFDFARGAIKSALEDYKADDGMTQCWYWQEATNRTEALLEALDTKSPYIGVLPEPPMADERAAFETWWMRDVPTQYRASTLRLLRQSLELDGKYGLGDAQGGWEGWSARASLPNTAVPEEPTIPAELHHDTAKLVRRFAHALANKLLSAQRKYGYSDNWMRDDWAHECRADLMRHVHKGDPRDVAAYCAFLWHHNESTAPVHPAKPAAIPAGYTLVPIEPDTAMLDRAVAFALNVKIGGKYRWTEYMRDLWARFLADVTTSPTQADAQAGLTDRQIADAVNTLRDIAILFHDAQQLRERIAGVVVPLLSAHPARPGPSVPLLVPCPVCGGEAAGHIDRLERTTISPERSVVAADDPISALLELHAEVLEQNDYAYFELARTRRTDWMAWICSNHLEADPNRKVLAKGQGGTPRAACADALKSFRAGGA